MSAFYSIRIPDDVELSLCYIYIRLILQKIGKWGNPEMLHVKADPPNLFS